MNNFKSGRLEDIFTEKVMYPTTKKNIFGVPYQDLNQGSSYYVQVTYRDFNGVHTVDAVMHFNGNSKSFGFDSIQLTDANGTALINILDYGSDLNSQIKVYDIPENDGTATVEGLRTLNQKVTTPEQGSNVVNNAISDVSMKTILGETYNKDCPDILYASKLDISGGTVFSSFVELSGPSISSIMTSIKDIEGLLSETKSDAFYSGTTAKNEINKLHTLSNNIESFKTRLEKLEPSELKNRIEEYNDKFLRTKKLTRLNLLQKRINSINNQKILVEEYSKRVDPGITVSTIPKDTISYEDGKYMVETKYVATPSGSQFNFNQYKMTVKKYIFIQYSTRDGYQQLEELIESVGQELPYDKTRIVED